jgi:hypothetical protein
MYDRGEIMSREEQLEIINWLCSNFIEFTGHRPDFTEATLYENNLLIPKIVWEIRDRIIKKEGIEEYRDSYNEDFFLKYHGDLTAVTRDKISIILPGKPWSRIYPHIDINQPNRIHTRFNIFLSVPEKDGTTYYGGYKAEVKERGYVICRSGIDNHYTEHIRGDTPRITLSLGFQLPPEVLDKLYQIPPEKRQWSWYEFRMQLFQNLNTLMGIDNIPKMPV